MLNYKSKIFEKKNSKIFWYRNFTQKGLLKMKKKIDGLKSSNIIIFENLNIIHKNTPKIFHIFDNIYRFEILH